MMRVFVTGAGGFIGSALSRYLHAHGMIVRGSSHDISRLEPLAGFLEQSHEFGFDSQLALLWFEGCDAVIHCAYDARPGAGPRNIHGTRRIYEAAESAGVPFQLFLSSHSARPDAISEYAQQKYEIECFFLQQGQAVVRPGLVIGNGGLYARNRKAIMRAPFLVLPGADQVPVYFVALRDLLESVIKILEGRMVGAFNLFCDQTVTLRQFVTKVRQSEGSKPRVISVPIAPMFWLLKALRWMRASLPNSFARLEVVRQNIDAPVHISDLGRFVITQQDINSAENVRVTHESH